MEIEAPEFECKRQFGDSLFTFYVPIDIYGFTVMLWSSESTGETFERRKQQKATTYDSERGKLGTRYSVSIYENGSLINPNDFRFRKNSWAKKLDWAGEPYFIQREINEMLEDLRKMNSTSRI